MASKHNDRISELPLLAPLSKPIGVFQQWISQRTQTIALKEKVLALGDSFYLEDAITKQPILQCEGKFATLRKRKTISDMQGNPVFILREKLLSLPKDYKGLDPQDEDKELFLCTTHMSLTGARQTLKFRNVFDGNNVELKLKGSFWNFKATITLDGQTVAYVSRSFLNVREIVFDNETFYVTVAAGVDIALILGFVLCLASHEEKKEKS